MVEGSGKGKMASCEMLSAGLVLTVWRKRQASHRLDHWSASHGPDPHQHRSLGAATVWRVELRWKGRLLLPGIFDAEHSFRLTALESGRTLFSHEETFTGFLVPLAFRGALKRGTERGFEAMNRALKHRAEWQAMPDHPNDPVSGHLA